MSLGTPLTFNGNSGSGAGDASPTVTLPGSIVTGSLGMMFIVNNATAAPLTPATGWTIVAGPANNSGTTLRIWILTKTMTSAESGTTVTHTMSTGGRWVIGGLIIPGADTSVGIEQISANTQGTGSTSFSMPNITPTNNDEMLIGCWSLRNTTQTPTWSVAGGWTEDVDTGTSRSATTNNGVQVSHLQLSGQAGVSQTGPTVTISASSDYHGWILSVTPTAFAQASGTVAAVATTVGDVTARLLATGTAAAVAATIGDTTVITAPVTYAASGQVDIVSTTSGDTIVTGKPGQGNEVLVLFNPDEVLTEGRVTYYGFDLLDELENYVGQLVGVSEGEVSIDAYSSVKGTGSLTVYTDPPYRDLEDGQPAFLGAQMTTLTGAQATAQSASSTPDYLVATNAESATVSLGDQVILLDSTGTQKESTVFTVVSQVAAGGFTNVGFSPDAAAVTAAGDVLAVVTVSFTNVVDWLNVRIRPMIRIARLGGGDDPDGTLVPCGVFLCAAPVENWTAAGQARSIELTDKLSILDQDIASGDPSGLTAYSAAAGANIITLVQGLIGETGERYPAIQPDTKVLSSALVWDIGTTRLKIINDLLDAGGYFSLWCDGWGQYQATTYVQPSDRVPVYESIAPFSDGSQSLMDPAWTRDRDIYSIPNRYLVVGQGDGTTAALTSIVTNTDPDSPYSYAARGRWITTVETGVEAATQTELDTIARARLSSATSVTNQITLSHVFLPDLHINSVVKFVNPGSYLDVYCYVVNTTIPFDPVKLCTTVMRVVGG